MKKLGYIILSALAIAFITLSSCHIGCIHGSGNASTQNRKPGNFIKIDVEGGLKVILKQDSSHQVIVTADDNLQKYIHTIVTGNMLRIYNRKNFCTKSPVIVVIGVSNLELFRGSGAIELSNEGKLNVKDLNLDLSGASKVNLNISAAHLTTEGSGSTEMYFKGQAASHKLELNGSGKVSAFDLVTGDYDIDTAGAADVEINVLHSLKTNTTGAADIKYKGSPENIQNEKSGSSSVKKVE